MYRSDEACGGRFCRRLIREMFSGIGNGSRHTIEDHAKASLPAGSAGVIQNKKS
ncbi:hypothetical protein [Herbaspirillum lusitanum]|uniref:hypothetical protein n=1 Tax=Herbaspirillum lusitanum TaxID=213312 RepID=UPI0012F4BED9|nr:hypothetical protein [Herbaspirillum lusitanum]